MAFVVVHQDGTGVCWDGSTNFTAAGWLGGNSAPLFVDQAGAAKFVAYFKQHRDWALAHQ